MQGAIHSSVFEVLQSYFCKATCSMSFFEGFASPFNATLPRFASAFPDLDWHFGSVGRFLDCNFGRKIECDGCYDTGKGAASGIDFGEYCEANPPFSPGIMLAMANHMIKALHIADKNSTRLTFVVVVPTANKEDEGTVKHFAIQSFQSMISSTYWYVIEFF